MFSFHYQTDVGYPEPLGATPDKDGVNFSLFSKNATRVVLCLFNGWGYETARIPLKEKTGNIWHVYVRGLKAGQRYAYRVDGPFEPEKGLRFNFNKLLLDPAAKLLTRPVLPSPLQMAYRRADDMDDLSFDKTDSADVMPKCIVVKDNPPAMSSCPHTPWDETIIYETHLKGFTKLYPRMPVKDKGTFAGMTAKKVVSYFKSLGMTSVELLPITSFVQSEFLKRKKLSNYWGYDPICFMAPEPTYLANRQLSEIQTMVRVFHEAGIEVLMDVVYNHTGEGNQMGPTLCYRGIDNPSYYRLVPDNPRYYMNDTGCGNMLNFDTPEVVSLVQDSLKYWTQVFDVDGFRFDLATTLGRTGDGGFSSDAPFYKTLSQTLPTSKIIVEPWDIGWGGYQFGQFNPSFGEWNDKFRDTFRRFWKGDFGQIVDAFEQFTGTQPDGKFPRINYLTAHDGLTLYDVVSYNQKHNDANGEENKDGADNNWSWNSGTEGQTRSPDILKLRFTRAKAMMATLLLANGTPMVLGGDEFLRTQFGNNNAYAQDNEISWLNWKKIPDYGKKMQRFVESVLTLRRDFPFFEGGKPASIYMMNVEGKLLKKDEVSPNARHFAFCLSDEKFYYMIVLNALDKPVLYHFPKNKWAQGSVCLLDTAESSLLTEDNITVAPWSFVVLASPKNQKD